MRAAAAVILFSALLAGAAEAAPRSLKLFNTHTGERIEITYKKNGRFIPSALRELNRFLRDWRRNESIKMDPELFDLIWDVYQKSGSKDYIHTVSGYRSPATNNMLRRRSRGVAKFSQHTRGKAMDFFLPDVKISTLRKIGLRKEIGGVGYYPKSNSPFVHLDTGSVRHWPRMTRRQLARVFPNGKTVHVPSDGKPMPGYKQAQAALKRRKKTGGQRIVVASASPRPPARVRGGDSDGAPIQPVPANRSNIGAGFIASLFSNNSGSRDAGNATRAPGAIAASVLPGVRPQQKPGAASPKPAETPGAIANEVPILVAALPPSKPRPARLSNPADAISALTDAGSARSTAADAAPGGVLAYASAVPQSPPRPLPPTFSGANAAGGAIDRAAPGRRPLAVAALQDTAPDDAELRAFAPKRLVGADRPQLSITGSFPREHDPFARFAALSGLDGSRLLSGDVSTRTQAFAALRHPDQRRLGGLIGRPSRILVAQFDQNVYGALRTDQFIGPAVVSLPLASTE